MVDLQSDGLILLAMSMDPLSLAENVGTMFLTCICSFLPIAG